MKNLRNDDLITFNVREACALLPFLMQAMRGISRNRAKLLLGGGAVRVDGVVRTRHDHALQPGDRVDVSRRKPRATLRSPLLRIVHEDPHLVVVEKGTGLLSMATTAGSQCVKRMLDDYFAAQCQRCRAHVVHRLDRETSGLLVYAKTREAEQILEHNWHDIVTDRRYVALVSGRMEQDRGTLSSWLRENAAYLVWSSPVDNGGKLAVTHYETLRRSDDYSLVRLKLDTGRKHQIRVQLSDMGHPVCGDTKYGDGRNPIGRLALHAFRLCFYHPVTGRELRFETDVPRSFLSVFKAGKKHP